MSGTTRTSLHKRRKTSIKWNFLCLQSGLDYDVMHFISDSESICRHDVKPDSVFLLNERLLLSRNTTDWPFCAAESFVSDSSCVCSVRQHDQFADSMPVAEQEFIFIRLCVLREVSSDVSFLP